MAKRHPQHLRQSAKGEECLLRLFPHCVGWENSDSVVLCHMPTGDGKMGGKGPDTWAAYGCSVCHDIIDGRIGAGQHQLSRHDIITSMLRGICLTQERMKEKGLITVKGEK